MAEPRSVVTIARPDGWTPRGYKLARSRVSLVIPRVTTLSDSVYAGVCAGLLGLGALVSTVRGWRLANRLLRARREASGST